MEANSHANSQYRLDGDATDLKLKLKEESKVPQPTQLISTASQPLLISTKKDPDH